MIKLLGIVLILISTFSTGMAMVGGVRATLDQTRALQSLLQLMHSEIQCHMTPLPDIFAQGAKTISGPIGELCGKIANAFQKGDPQTFYYAIQSSIGAVPKLLLPRSAQGVFLELAKSLGRYDLDSQLTAITHAQERLERICITLESEREGRCRSYGAVCACAGLCFLIIVI